MIIDRALEILNSKENIRVLYANDPVWIESVDTENRKATVSIVGTAQTMEVLVSSLTDTGSPS
jgi:H-type small acid-soluble spore protein